MVISVYKLYKMLLNLLYMCMCNNSWLLYLVPNEQCLGWHCALGIPLSHVARHFSCGLESWHHACKHHFSTAIQSATAGQAGASRLSHPSHSSTSSTSSTAKSRHEQCHPTNPGQSIGTRIMNPYGSLHSKSPRSDVNVAYNPHVKCSF